MPQLLSLVALALARGAAGGAIAAFSTTSLDGSFWTATAPASGAAVAATVPGDLVSFLSASGSITDPWLDLTWREQAGQWDLQAWTLTRLFASPAQPPSGDTWLVLDSVKMAASIYLNGQLLGEASNQHVRYVFPVGALLLPAGGSNNLSIAFPPTVADARNDAGRFMGASGGCE